MEKSMIQCKIAQLPQNPGVYFFYGQQKELLYIGKATNLRNRAQSYFRGEHNRGEWISKMISLIEDIDFQETDSVLEALILESNLIKKHQPKYNTLEKDDKSFAYFLITKEDYPKVLIIRGTDLLKMSKSKYQISNKIQNKDDKAQKKFKYEDVVAGKTFGPYTSKLQMQTALKIIRRIFPFHSMKQKSEKGCLDFQLGVCPGPYSGSITKEEYKKNIRGIKMILEGKKKSLISKMEKEMHSFAKKHEFEKAANLRNKIFALQHIRDIALMSRGFDSESIQDTRYKIQNTRIEAYDISNISGDHAVGSMVVFENGTPNKNQYRKFKIKTVTGSDDVGMMREVLLRRFKNDWPMPDLILLDGGLGHLNMAEKLLYEELGLSVALASVAKGPTRKKLDIRIAQNTKYKIQNTSKIDPQDVIKEIRNTLQDNLLLKLIMDEAHRFAITFHRNLRRKNALN